MYQHRKPVCNIVTIGHAGHGKSALAAAIKKVLTEKYSIKTKTHSNVDVAPDESIRGLAMYTTHIDYETETRNYTLIDYPTHDEYMKNAIVSDVRMDGAVLVVDVTSHITAQTRDQILLARQLGLEHVIPFLNKVDLVDDYETVDLMKVEINMLLEEMDFDTENVPITTGSALCALDGVRPQIGFKSILRLLRCIDHNIPLPIPESDKPFLLPVDDIYTIPDKGTAITGRLERGVLKIGSECEFLGHGQDIRSTITGIEIFRHTFEEAEAGHHLIAFIGDVNLMKLHKGMVMCTPDSVKYNDHVEAQIYVLSEEEGGDFDSFPTLAGLEMFSRSWKCLCALEIPEKEIICPGEYSKVYLKMHQPVVLEQGQRFKLKNDNLIVAIGVVTEILS